MINQKIVLLLVVFFMLMPALEIFSQEAQPTETIKDPGEQIKSLQEEINKLKIDAANNKRILTVENTELLNQIESLKKTNKELKMQNAELKSSNAELSVNPKQLKEQLLTCNNNAKMLDEKLKELEKQYTDFPKEKDLLLKKAEAFDKEKAGLEEAISALEKDSASSSETYKKTQEELKRTLGKLSSAEKNIKDLTSDKFALKERLLSSQKKYAPFENENKRLRGLLVPVKDLKNKLATAYQLVGTAYIQLKKYDLAIDAYCKSLKYNFKNPLVHCNLGLLYEHSRSAGKKAIKHLKIYLKLDPDAPDAREIKYIIERLSEVNKDDKVFFEHY